LLGIATRAAPKSPMEEAPAARITSEGGVGSDYRGKPGRRQVTVMTRGGWEAACAELGGGSLPWTTRRANLFVEGLELQGKVGYDLRIGDAVLTISGETRPCERMNQAHPGLMRALDPEWRAGVTCRVIRSGDVSVGCEVILSRNPLRQAAWVGYTRGRQLLRRGRGLLGDAARRLGRHRKLERA
jgi:MOSC domain-containing protein YiiM